MANTTGNTGADLQLGVDLTLSTDQMLSQLEKALSSLSNSALIHKAAVDIGEKFRKSLSAGVSVDTLGKALQSNIDKLKQVKELQKQVEKGEKPLTMIQKAKYTAFHGPFVKGLTDEAEQLKLVEAKLRERHASLIKLMNSFATLANSAPKSKQLESFSLLPDESKLKKSQKSLDTARAQLAEEKKYLDELKKMRDEARKLDNKPLVAVLGQSIAQRERRVKNLDVDKQLATANKAAEKAKTNADKQKRDDANQTAKDRQAAAARRVQAGKESAKAEAALAKQIKDSATKEFNKSLTEDARYQSDALAKARMQASKDRIKAIKDAANAEIKAEKESEKFLKKASDELYKTLSEDARFQADALAKARMQASKERIKAIRDAANADVKAEKAAEKLDQQAIVEHAKVIIAERQKAQEAILKQQAKYEGILRRNAGGRDALLQLKSSGPLNIPAANLNKDNTAEQTSRLKEAIKLLTSMEGHYNKIAEQRRLAGQDDSSAITAMQRIAALANGYKAELQQINSIVKDNSKLRSSQEAQGQKQADAIMRQMAAEKIAKEQLLGMDRAAMVLQLQRARLRDAEFAKIRRANPVDKIEAMRVVNGTSRLPLQDQNEVINKSIALQKALVAQYDKVIVAEAKLGKDLTALNSVRDTEAAKLQVLKDRNIQLAESIRLVNEANKNSKKNFDAIQAFYQKRFDDQQKRELRRPQEKLASDTRLAARGQGTPALVTGTTDQLKLQNSELEKALAWHNKTADALARELGEAKKLNTSYTSIEAELKNETAEIAKIEAEHQAVNAALKAQVKLEEQSIRNNNQLADKLQRIKTNLAANIKGSTAANREGDALVKAGGGYGGFNATGLKKLKLEEAQAATAALKKMASELESAYTKQEQLGKGSVKLSEYLGKVATSAKQAEIQLAQMEREAARAHGVKRFGEELGSTIKNFAKFAVIYQGLYSLIGFFRGLTDAVVDLNKELANMQAITASSTEEMKGISTAILSVASSSRFSIADVTEAAKVIAQAGASAEELPKILQSVTDFAAGTDTALGTAADIITSVREVYKNLSDAQVANQLTKAVNISKLSGEDLKTIMSIGAQVAEGYNVTSEQMLAAASTLRNAGVKASTISTGLRQALLEVFNPQDNTVKALQKQYAKLGQNLSEEVIKARFYNFSKEADPLMAVLRELKTLGFGGEGDFSLGRAFDVRALNVLKEMVKSTDEYLALQRELTFGQPAAEAAATSMESLSASWQKFKNVWTASIFDESGPFLKGLQTILDKMTEVLDKRRELANEEKAKGQYGAASAKAGFYSNPLTYAGFGATALGAASLITPFTAPAAPYLVGAGTAMLAGAAGNEGIKLKYGSTSSASRLEGARGVASTSQENLDKAQAAYDAYRTDTKDSGVGKELYDTMTLATNVRNAITETLGADALNSDEVSQILKELQGTNTIERRKELIAKLQTLAQDSNKVTFESVGSLITMMEEASGSTRAMVANFASLHKQLTEVASREGPDAEKAKEELAKLAAVTGPDGSSPMLKLLMGNGTPEQIQEQYRVLMETLAKSKAEGIQALTDKQIQLDGEVFSAALADVEALPQGQRTARVQQLVTGYLAKIAQMGEESGQKALLQLGQRFAAAFGVGGIFEKIGGIDQGYLAKTYGFSIGDKGHAPLPGLGGAPLPPELAKFSQDLRDKEAKKKAEIEQERLANLKKVSPELSKQTYVANPAVTAQANALDFEIQKLQKFGDAAGKAGDLIQEKNSLLVSEKNEELKVLLHNREVAKQYNIESTEYKKADADVAEKQLEIQKLQLQGQEDLLDNMQKSAERQMGMYDQQKETILAAGGSFDGITELNDKYVATQKGLIASLEAYMRDTLHMTEDEIKNYIESRPELKKGFLSDKDYNAVDKKNNARIKAAEAAIPKSATTGNALMDARARAGLGFTNAEEVKFAADKAIANQNLVALYTELNASDSVLAKTADAATAEAIQAKIDTRVEGIKNLNNELQDLAAQIEDFSTTAAEELASVFDDKGIRFFTHALETSGNALKDWGDNIRNSLVTAWDSVGDAISSALLDGENFVDSMKKIARDLAREVFTMTTKNVMNNLLLGGLTGSYGGAAAGGAQGQTPATTTPAPGGSGFLASIAAAAGLSGPKAAAGGLAGSAVGTMTVNAGVVNVNGVPGGGAVSAVTGALNPAASAPAGKGVFQTVEEKISSGMDSVMSSLESAFKGLDKGLGGLLSGIGNIASDLFKGATGGNGWLTKGVAAVGQWFGMTASTGAIIPMKFAGGYVSRSGVIKGAGSGTSDSIRGSMFTKSGRAPIMVSSGESILTAKATSMLGENTIRSLNAGTARKFSTGGMVAKSRSNADAANLKTQAPSVTVNPAAPQSIQMINAIDSDSVVQAGLSSPASVKTLINVVKANKSAFKSVLN